VTVEALRPGGPGPRCAQIAPVTSMLLVSIVLSAIAALIGWLRS